MSALEKRKPKYNVLKNGYIIPKSFVPEIFENACSYVPGPGDVFICTYPKCGTTWTQCILHLMLNRGEPLQPGLTICEAIPHLEEDGKDFVSALPKPRIMKTHLPYAMLPKSQEAQYIYVARNPKDCCVSFYYHTKGFSSYDFADGRFGDYFDLFLAGEVDYGDYFDHLLAYLPRKNDPNVLFLLYEDMKSDIRGCVWKIGRFLGGRFLRSIQEASILEKIVENSAFETMKSTPSVWSCEQIKGSPGFVRRGEIGDWRRHFTAEQSKRMDERFRSKLGGTEAEHFWDNYDIF